MNDFQTGSLEVICGPMFSGKSEELIRRIKRVQISGKRFLLFKPAIDNRYDLNHVVSHDQRKFEAIVTGIDSKSVEKMKNLVDKEFPEVIAMDEIWLYDSSIVNTVLGWVNSGKRVIIATLDTNFRGEPFQHVGTMLTHADHVDKLKAICMKCKNKEANMTQRLVNGKPAKYSDPLVLIAGADSYEARCRNCHEISH